MLLRHLPFLFFFLPLGLSGQAIKGTLTDAQSEMPLVGATVELISVTPLRGTTTDVDGYFSITDVPAGRHQLRISYLGYLPRELSNILVTTGKEVILSPTLEESVAELSAVTVSAQTGGTAPTNEMSTVSARTFTAEQVNRFAGGRADVSRLAGNLAGVATSDDSRNDIVIRGNTGNRDRYEFMGQLGSFSGLEFMAEGPRPRSDFERHSPGRRPEFHDLGRSRLPLPHHFYHRLRSVWPTSVRYAGWNLTSITAWP